jgi:catechol 2,3-dioxygenase-like lactoylglutathione lyase family enzyme
MKRFHVHVGVDDLDKNIAFYTSMFGQAPAVVKDDYAKWMLDDPRINFAISNRGLPQGVDHLGFQTETGEELSALRAAKDDGVTSCCYAKSDKYWITDPQGIAWETFHTLDNIPTFAGVTRVAGASATTTASSTACCTPSPAAINAASEATAAKPAAKSACC